MPVPAVTIPSDIKSHKFPSDFAWGYATASAQVEGSIDVDGKGPSIWDTFSADPSHSEDGGSTKVATDFYNQYQADIDMMKSYGVNAHRMSLSWSRIIPNGTGEVNQKGVDFYRKVIKALLDAGITPFVTLFHWDLPQAFQDKYLGFLSKDIVPDFENYARVCFESFPEVKNWFTINEPNIYSLLGHAFGRHAPGRSSNRSISPEGDTSTEPFIVGHNLLLAHATTVKLYRERFKTKQRGQIGLVVNMNWAEPLTDSEEDVEAAEYVMALTCRWFAEPLKTGDYPPLLKTKLGDKLPTLTSEEKTLLKGSTDFLAINHYTTYMVSLNKTKEVDPSDMWAQILPGLQMTFNDKDGNEIAPAAGLSWVRPVPWGFGKLMAWAYENFGFDIYISETGVVCPNENHLTREEAVEDDFRIDYLESYADQMALAISKGIPVKSALFWAWTDNFEWQEGFTARFGVVWIDYKDNCKRYPKKSVGHMKKYFEERMEKA